MDPAAQLQKVANFRDVGQTVNDFLGQKRIREGVFFRSARPDDATDDDKKIIKDGLGLKTVIDLRTKTEHLKQAQKRQAQMAALAPAHSNTALAQTAHIEGLEYHEIKITGRSFEKHLVSQLSWGAFIKFLVLFLLGYRLQAISIIGREVMLPRGLVGLGVDTLDYSGSDIRDALTLYTSPHSMPIVIHCTHGKDRTGLMCALILMALNVPTPAIEHDYFLTDAALAPERDARLAEIREIGLTDDWAGTAEDMISGIEKHLYQKYGGVERYLDHIGFGADDRAKLRDTLLY